MEQVKHALILSYEFPPIIGGAGVYAHDLALGLRKNGMHVTVLTYRHIGFERIKEMLLRNGIEVFTVPNVKVFHFFIFFGFIKVLCNRRKFDVVVFNDGRAKRIGTLFQNSLKKILPRSVSILHGNEKSSMIDSPSRVQKFLRLNNRVSSFFDKQRNVIVVSRSEYDIWKSYSFKDKIVLINHGIDIDIFFTRTSDQIAALRARYGLDDDTYVIFSASRLIKEKGQEVLIECMPDLIKLCPKIVLFIAGNGIYEKHLMQKVQLLGLENHVVFVGGVNREVLSELYAISHVFVLPSQLYESFGLVYLEAAACSIISIASNRGGTNDAILHEETGYLVDAFDKQEIKNRIISVLQNDLLRARMSIAAYNRVQQHFTNYKMAEKLIKCFSDVN